jgi:hypothetical protein
MIYKRCYSANCVINTWIMLRRFFGTSVTPTLFDEIIIMYDSNNVYMKQMTAKQMTAKQMTAKQLYIHRWKNKQTMYAL